MNIVVIIRQTPDTEAKIKVNQNKIENDVTWVINPYDEFAIEKALKIKESAGEGEVVLLACGPSRTEEAIRQGLAMGADRAVFIKDDSLEYSDPYVISKLIASQLKNIPHDLIITGKKVIDLETSQIPNRVAEGLELPCVSYVVKFQEVAKDKATVNREVDGSHEVVEVQLPAVVTCDRGDDIPRYASITGIMKAKKKEIKEVALDSIDLGSVGISKEAIESGAKIEVVDLELPPARKEVQIFDGSDVSEKVQKLVKALREEAKVI